MYSFSPTEESFDALPAATVPEMQRSDLAPVVLQLKALGISNILRFNFLSVSKVVACEISHTALGVSNIL